MHKGQTTRRAFVAGTLCTAAAASCQKLAAGPLSPSALGAVPHIDQYPILQQWADLLGDGVVGVIDADYVTSRQLLLMNKRNFGIEGPGSLTVAAGTPAAYGHSALMIRNCSDFALTGFTVDGNRELRSPKESSAHSIQILSCHRFTVARVRSVNAVTDGFYLATTSPKDRSTYCSDFLFDHCEANNCFRQGMSIIQGQRGILRDCTFSQTNGTAPEAGVDLESNKGNLPGAISDILIERCHFIRNAGYGLQVSRRAFPSNIRVLDCTFKGNGRGPTNWTTATSVR